MLNYVTNMRAAAKDAAARYGMTAGAAVIFLIAVAFLIAALWVFTARHWGSLVTNLAFAGGFAVLGAIILAVARSYRVAAPSVEDLRDEVEAKLVDKASALVDQAELRVNRFVARTEHRVSHLAAGVFQLRFQVGGVALGTAEGQLVDFSGSSRPPHAILLCAHSTAHGGVSVIITVQHRTPLSRRLQRSRCA